MKQVERKEQEITKSIHVTLEVRMSEYMLLGPRARTW